MTTRIHAPAQPAGREVQLGSTSKHDPLSVLGVADSDPLDDAFGASEIPVDVRREPAKASTGDAFGDALDAAFGSES